MRTRNVLLFVLIICMGFSNLYSQDESKTPAEQAPEVKAPLLWGFIFNANNLLLDIDSYQAGVGIKVLQDDNVAIRYLADVFYSNSSQALSGTLGITYEKHFKPGRISPYWGGFVEAGYIGQKSEIDSDNWARTNQFPLSVGTVLGAEFFIMEFLSVFAEYSLSLNGSIAYTATSTNGDVARTDPVLNYSIDSGIGNNSSLGIIIYMDNVIDLKKKDKEE